MPKAIVESSRLPVCPHWEATMKLATVSAIVSVIALGSAVFLSPAQADTYELTTIIAGTSEHAHTTKEVNL